MKKLTVFLIMVMLSVSALAQSKKKTAVKAKPKPQPIVYKDENDNILSQDDFDERYDFEDKNNHEKIFKNGRLIEIKLKKNLRENQPLNDFTATTLDGKTIDTKELRGKVLVINFWFIACKGCIEEFPILNNLQAKFKDNENVVFIALTFDKLVSIRKFLPKKPFNYQIIPDAQQIFDDVFKYDGFFPVNLIIGKDGTLTRWQSGVYVPAKFEARIQAELEKDYKSASTNP
jgi:peroxiredoxin